MSGTVQVSVLRAALVTPGSPWQGVEHHPTVGSTNALAAGLGAPWQVVVADHQSAGRGRLARSWEAPPGTSVAVSATLPLLGTGAGWLPLAAGLAVAEALDGAAGPAPLGATLKWPNDVLLAADAGRKVCGILCEVPAAASGGPPDVVVVGAGVNLTQTRDQLPVDTATSLALAGLVLDDTGRTALVAGYLERLAHWYGVLSAGDLDVVRRAYLGRCATVGQQVRLETPHGAVTGAAVAVDDDGRLRLRPGGGGPTTSYAAGDVVHLRPAAP